MTDEEKAEEEIFNEWKSEQYKDQSTEEKMEFVEHLHTFPWYFKKAFIAGLKAGKDMAEADLATVAYMQGAERYKTKWHDLRKAPNDLPLNTAPVLCLGSTGFIVCKYISGSWVDNQTIKLVPKYIDIYKWCEIEDTEE